MSALDLLTSRWGEARPEVPFTVSGGAAGLGKGMRGSLSDDPSPAETPDGAR